MNDLSPRRRNLPSRQVREERAYRLGLAAGGAGLVSVVGVLLAVVGVVGAGLPVAAAIVAAICALLFWRTVSG